ncbi:MAG: cysteine peptidase family C39 domain-containing protein [Armatimonadetes bacterium]|nr:cysteine peptidase family C39 domain-containing protein [Armatimonadota bacterium]
MQSRGAQKRSSRREFLQKAALVGAGLAVPVFTAEEALAQTKPSQPVVPLHYGSSLWDEVGRLRQPVSEKQVTAWRDELRKRSLPKERTALLRLWLGEWELDAGRAPIKAREHFEKALKLAKPGETLHGWARYNAAVACFFEGKYAAAAKEFHTLLRDKKERGFSRQATALWARHVGACAAEHAALGDMGIPRPREVDPICGAAALAFCMRQLRMPITKKETLSKVAYTGRGSTMQDLLDACPKLGLSGHVIKADSEALKLFKGKVPMVAWVERDHFVACLHADEDGVHYSCSDCGMWPGGVNAITWKQWQAMRPGVYLAVAKPGSEEDKLLSHLTAPRNSSLAVPGVKVAMEAGSGQVIQSAIQLSSLYRSLAPHVVGFTMLMGVECGLSPMALQCLVAPWGPGCPDIGGPCGNCGEPLEGVEANAANGQVDVPAPSRLDVPNPNGPSVDFGPSYNSLRGPDTMYWNNDFGQSWTHDYKISVYDGSAVPPVPAPTGQVRQGNPTPNQVPITGAVAPANSSVTWEVYKGTTLVADSSQPQGWTLQMGFSYGGGGGYGGGYGGGGSNSTTMSVAAPVDAPTGNDYSARYHGVVYPQGIATKSGSFQVVSHGISPSTAPRYLVMPNGARVGFSASSVPSATNPTVGCAVSTGLPYKIDLCYDPNNTGGYYKITLPDGTRWTTQGISQVDTIYGYSGTAYALHYVLGAITDKVGNSITMTYARFNNGLGVSTPPVLTSIKDASTNTALLTLGRNGQGEIISASDNTGRTVHYEIQTYLTGGYVHPSVRGLTKVSQVVPTGTPAASAPMRSQYGYSQVQNGIYAYGGYETTPQLTSITVPSPTGTGTATGTIEYEDGTCYVKKLTGADGASVEFQQVNADGTPWDPYGNYQSGSYGGASLFTKVITKASNGAVMTSQTIGFDSNMNQTEIKTATGKVLSTSVYGDPTTPYRPTATIDGMGRTWSMTYDDMGNVLTRTTPRGVVTTYTYDYSFASGLLTSTQEGSKPPVTFSYLPNGLLQGVTYPAPHGSGATTCTIGSTYTTKGNLASISGPGNNAAAAQTVTFGYTQDGTYSQPEALARPLTITDANGNASHMRYDSRGNVTSAWDALGNKTDSEYNVAGQVTRTWLPAATSGAARGSVTNDYRYPSGVQSRTRVWPAGGGGAASDSQFTHYPNGLPSGTNNNGMQYPWGTKDAACRVTDIPDPNGNNTDLGYDDDGFPNEISYPGGNLDGDKTTFGGYNNAGQLTTRTDGNGKVANFTYADPEGKLTAVSFPASPADNVSMTYDSFGRPASRTDKSGTQTFTYGNLDEVTSVTTQYVGLPPQTISYTYHPDGSRKTMTTPAGTFTYNYDAGGRPTSMTNPFGETTTWTYQANDLLATQTSHNGLTAAYSFNGLGQLTALTNTIGGSAVATFNNMTYDAVGNRLTLAATIPIATALSGTTTYGYDSQFRLTGESTTRAGGAVNVFSYDNAGNPTVFKGQSRSYNAKNQHNASGFVYDKNGNPTTYNGTTIVYDVFDNPTQFGNVLSCGYTSEGLRAWKQPTNGTKRYFLYDSVIPICELDVSGNVIATNSMGAKGLVSRQESGTGSVFYGFDERGGTTVRTSASGAALSVHGQDGYGTLLAGIYGSADPYSGMGAQWGYYSEPETGFQLCTFRYYDQAGGKWVNRDPIGYMGGINLYGYCEGNPINKKDTLGWCSDKRHDDPNCPEDLYVLPFNTKGRIQGPGEVIGGIIGAVLGAPLGGLILGVPFGALGVFIGTPFGPWGQIGFGLLGIAFAEFIGGAIGSGIGSGIGSAIGSLIEDLIESWRRGHGKMSPCDRKWAIQHMKDAFDQSGWEGLFGGLFGGWILGRLKPLEKLFTK